MKKFKKCIATLAVTLTLATAASTAVMAYGRCACDCHTAPPNKPHICWCLGECK